MGHKAVFVATDRGELDREKASPDQFGNRAQRRAWAKLTKSKTPPVSSSVVSNPTEGDQEGRPWCMSGLRIPADASAVGAGARVVGVADARSTTSG